MFATESMKKLPIESMDTMGLRQVTPENAIISDTKKLDCSKSSNIICPDQFNEIQHMKVMVETKKGNDNLKMRDIRIEATK